MGAALAWVIRHPLLTGLSAALLASAAYIAVLKIENLSADAKLAKAQTLNVQLIDQKAALEASVTNLKVEIDLTKKTQETLVSTLNDLTKKAEAETSAVKDAENAPQTDDGPVAPVLRHALDGLRAKPGARR